PLTDVKPSLGLPDEMTLSQNYPNPFNPSTTIVWTVPTASKVTLKIYNPLGQVVGTLVDADMDPGEYATTWDATGFPAGAYFYRLQIGSQVQTRKLVLVK
ncbi:MAG: T9SS type A sorting domain-containing protein, partial [Bacteroidota bacterium]